MCHKRVNMEILKIFEKIASIPHCSGNTGRLQNFIVNFAKSAGFFVETDNSGNILCYKHNRDICLQSHYDMVCVGSAPAIELVRKENCLMAKNSSLGADNGIGVAIMLQLMREGIEAEYLFTNDEEIGLIGAKNLNLTLQVTKMINLDSEEFGKVYVGCAGGVDIVATKKIGLQKPKNRYHYKVTARNFPGGHSGVDIDKDIPNAIKEFALFAKGAQVAAIEAGERRNSIPVHLSALIATDKQLHSNEHFLVEPASVEKVLDIDLISILCAFPNGVVGWEKTFGIPSRSANLAKIAVSDKKIVVECSLRANSDEFLEALLQQYLCFWQSVGFEAKAKDRYPAWKPSITPLAEEIANKYKKFAKDIEFKAIHAGLECAIFAQKIPHMQIVSIGPDIHSPHSVHECVKLDTIEPIYQVLKELL